MKDISRLDRERSTSYAKNVLMLAAAQIVVKFFGFIMRVVIINIPGFGDVGNGYYSTGYQLYTVMLALSSIGIPDVISKLTSEKIVKGDFRGAHRIFQIALMFFTGLGLTLSLILFLGAQAISDHLLHSPGVVYTLRVLAPAITFISASAVMRGYYTGLGTLKASSISQVLEQIFNCVLTIAFVTVFIGKDAAVMAAAGQLSTTFSVVISCSYLVQFYRARRKAIREEIAGQTEKPDKRTDRQLLGIILAISIPTALGSFMSVMNAAIDTVTVSNCIQTAYRSIITDAKDLTAKAMELYGVLQKADTITRLPLAISAALCTALVPAISGAMAKGDNAGGGKRITDSLFLTLLFVLPCAAGFLVLADPILLLLYPTAPSGGHLFQLSTVIMVLAAVTFVFSGALYGLGKQKVTAILITVGIGIKLVLNLLLITNPAINIYGSGISSLVCQGFILVGECAVLRRAIRFELPARKLAKPFLASLLMGGIVLAAYALLRGPLGNTACTLLCILIGAVVYLFLALVMGMLTKAELLPVPGGKAVYSVLHKLKLMK